MTQDEISQGERGFPNPTCSDGEKRFAALGPCHDLKISFKKELRDSD